MNISRILSLLDGECLTGKEYLDIEVEYGFGCDLMSDVLAFSKGKTVLLTGLTNSHVIRTAEMLDINTIVFVRGKKPDDIVIEMAKNNNMTIISTEYILYNACGILYNNGLKGASSLKEISTYGK